MNPIDHFLAEVERRNPEVDERILKETLAEIRDHLDNAVADLRAEGWTVENAQSQAIKEFGSPIVVKPVEPRWFLHRSFWLPFTFWTGALMCVVPGWFSWVPYSFFETQIPTTLAIISFLFTMVSSGFWGGRRWLARGSAGVFSGLVCGYLLMACSTGVVKGIGNSTFVGDARSFARVREQVTYDLAKLRNIESVALQRQRWKNKFCFPREGGSMTSGEPFICDTETGPLILSFTEQQSVAESDWRRFKSGKEHLVQQHEDLLARLRTVESNPSARTPSFVGNTKPTVWVGSALPSLAMVGVGRILALFKLRRRGKRQRRATA